MRVKIYLNDSKEIASLSLLNNSKLLSTKDFQIKEEEGTVFGNIHCKYFSSPLYSIVRLDVSTRSTYEVMTDFDGSAVVMAFMKTGFSSCVAHGIEGCMCGKQNNVFFNHGLVKCRFKEATCFRIILSNTYIKMLTQLYPEVMAPLIEAIEEQRDCVFEHAHLVTTLEMEQIIKSIEDLPVLECGKEMFLEAKIRELLCLQINQYLNVLHNSDSKLEKYREKMQQACKYIEENMLETPTLHKIAMAVGVCDTTLKLAFKYFYGKTVFGYLNEYRMCKACELLRNSSFGISEVALQVGYEYSSHFSTAFNQKFGLSPLEYRKSLSA